MESGGQYDVVGKTIPLAWNVLIEWLRKLSPTVRVLVYGAAAIFAFVLAAGVGAMGALMLGGGQALPGRETPPLPNKQENAAQPQHEETTEKGGATKQKGGATKQKGGATKQEGATSRQDEAEYVRKVGDIQDGSVDTFLTSHEKLLRYDALTADNVEELRANEAALRGFADQANNLDPPQQYGEQYEVFGSAINELHEAGQLAYNLAADPTAATQSGFDEYDRHVNEATALLQRSNELLGKNYKTLEGVQSVNPLS